MYNVYQYALSRGLTLCQWLTNSGGLQLEFIKVQSGDELG